MNFHTTSLIHILFGFAAGAVLTYFLLRNSRPKFIAIPGYVRSPYDGDIHYLSARDLARLHRVPPNRVREVKSGYWFKPGDILLTPREDGRYQDYSA